MCSVSEELKFRVVATICHKNIYYIFCFSAVGYLHDVRNECYLFVNDAK